MPLAVFPPFGGRPNSRDLCAESLEPARAGVEGLEHGERVVVPGLPIRAAMLAGRYIPQPLKLPVLERIMRPSGGT